MTILNRDFFSRPTLTVTRELLGQRLVREVNGQRLSGLIVETEAYIGPGDTASHASKGRTTRTEAMFGPPGYAYIYLIYGMYHMLNLVTEQADFPAAVLIRAIEPQEGIEVMQSNRLSPLPGILGIVSSPPHLLTSPPHLPLASPDLRLTNGPGKLCQALAIDKTLHGWDVITGQQLWLEAAPAVPDSAVIIGPRIGIDYAHPTDRTAPWRFWVKGNRFVSR